MKYPVPNKLQMLPRERQVETVWAFQWYCDAFRISISRVVLKTLDNCKLPGIRGLGSRLDAFPAGWMWALPEDLLRSCGTHRWAGAFQVFISLSAHLVRMFYWISCVFNPPPFWVAVGTEPGTWCMLGKYCATELHPLPNSFSFMWRHES